MSNRKTRFDDYFESNAVLILDGGLGTQLQAQGLSLDSKLWSAHLLRDNPQAIIDAHLAYFEAGASCAIAASYQATVAGFMALELTADHARSLIVSAVNLAVKARSEYLDKHPQQARALLVAASIGPYGAALGDGSEYTGDYKLTDKTLEDFHRDRLMLLDHSQADVLACETIPSMQEAKVLHALLTQVETPAWITFSCSDGYHLSDGSPIAEVVALFSGHTTVRAIGINCTSPAYINSLITQIKTADKDRRVVVYPNSGEVYNAAEHSWSGTTTASECGLAAGQWLRNGATILGGCCRMGPDHIASIRHNCR